MWWRLDVDDAGVVVCGCGCGVIVGANNKNKNKIIYILYYSVTNNLTTVLIN